MLHNLIRKARSVSSLSVFDVLFLAGCACVVYGVGLVYGPAAWIVGGTAAAVLGFFGDRGDA